MDQPTNKTTLTSLEPHRWNGWKFISNVASQLLWRSTDHSFQELFLVESRSSENCPQSIKVTLFLVKLAAFGERYPDFSLYGLNSISHNASNVCSHGAW